MQKKPLQDVIPPRTHTARRPRPQVQPESHTTPTQPPVRMTKPPHHSRSPHWRIWVIAVATVVVLGFAISFLFADSKVIAYPKNRQSTLSNTTFEMFRDPQPGQLGFQVMSLEETSSETTEATSEETVSTKASGTIIVYNGHSTAPQRLIKDTRFETPDGLIYRIPEAVTVPGQHKVGGETVPGQIEVNVYADQPGAEYNIDLSDFTIPGFAGSPRFKTFFARSKTPMTGGFDGVRKTISNATRSDIETRLTKALREKIMAGALAQKPNGFLLYNDAIFVDILPATETADGSQVTISMKARLTGLLINADTFASFIAANTIAGYDGEPVRLDDPNSLTVTLLEKGAIRPESDERVSLAVEGPLQVVWTFDATQFAADIAGKQKAALPTILTGYPAIERADAVLRPFWRRSFPEKPSEITVVEKLDG